MSEPAAKLAAATARSNAARERLAGTLGDLQARLAPQRLLRDGMEELRGTATDVGRAAAERIRDNPGQAAGLLFGLIIFFARDSVADLIVAAGRKARRPFLGGQHQHQLDHSEREIS